MTTQNPSVGDDEISSLTIVALAFGTLALVGTFLWAAADRHAVTAISAPPALTAPSTTGQGGAPITTAPGGAVDLLTPPVEPSEL